MVVDEELKMMAPVCDRRRAGRGPDLQGDGPPRAHRVRAARGAPRWTCGTCCGRRCSRRPSSAARWRTRAGSSSRYEPAGRGYYGGALALIGRDAGGARDPGLADPHPHRRHRRRRRGCGSAVGATLVRGLGPGRGGRRRRGPRPPGCSPRCDAGSRPARLGRTPGGTPRRCGSATSEVGRFWLRTPLRTAARPARRPALGRATVLVVDAEDTFTACSVSSCGPWGWR